MLPIVIPPIVLVVGCAWRRAPLWLKSYALSPRASCT